ncbi:hypothetical protein QN239_20305 [Mycolicibacterium sp. Y3]
MSLEDLDTEVAGYRAQAEQLTDEFKLAHAEIESDPRLSADGKREQLEPLHADVVEQINALRDREKAAIRGKKANLERRLFGLSSTASNDPAKLVSFRDAQSRARQLEDADDAAELYESAKRSGDTILATAVLEKALVRGWSNIKEDYLATNTTARKDLDDLAALAKYTDNSLMNLVHYVPPALDLPHSAGFPNVPVLHASRAPQGPRPLRPGFGTR